MAYPFAHGVTDAKFRNFTEPAIVFTFTEGATYRSQFAEDRIKAFRAGKPGGNPYGFVRLHRPVPDPCVYGLQRWESKAHFCRRGCQQRTGTCHPVLAAVEVHGWQPLWRWCGTLGDCEQHLITRLCAC